MQEARNSCFGSRKCKVTLCLMETWINMSAINCCYIPITFVPLESISNYFQCCNSNIFWNMLKLSCCHFFTVTFTYLCLTKGHVKLFWPETIVEDFLHLITFFCKVSLIVSFILYNRCISFNSKYFILRL